MEAQIRRLTRLGWWLHSQRPKHFRLMARAEAYAESGFAYRRLSVKHEDSEMLVLGWSEIRRCIGTVVECGCPRRLWSETVQRAVSEGDPSDRVALR